MEDLPKSNCQKTKPKLSDVSVKQLKGRDLLSGEALRLDVRFERRNKRIEDARIITEFLNSPQYRVQKLQNNLINKKIDIGKTTDGRKVVGKIKTIKKTEIRDNKHLQETDNALPLEINKTENVISDNKVHFTICDDPNFTENNLLGLNEISNNSIENSQDSNPLLLKPPEIDDNDTLDLLNDILLDHKYTEFNFEPFNHEFENHTYAGPYNEMLEDHTYTNFRNVCFDEILRDHSYTSFNNKTLAGINTSETGSVINELTNFDEPFEDIINTVRESEDFINYEDPDDLILSSYNSLLSINVVTQHNYSRLSKNSKNRPNNRSSSDKSNPTETVNLHEYPKKIISSGKHAVVNKSRKKQVVPSITVDANNKKQSYKNKTKDEGLKNEKDKNNTYSYCFTCTVCKRRFSRLATLQKHAASCSVGNKTYLCSFCGWSYPNVSSLTRHIVEKHVDKSTAKFKTDSDNKMLLFEVPPATEIITEDSIILQEDSSFTIQPSNIKQNETVLATHKILEIASEEEIPVLKVDAKTLERMEKSGIIEATNRLLDNFDENTTVSNIQHSEEIFLHS